MSETFTTEVVLEGKTATGLQVPDHVVAAFGVGKRPPVVVTIGAHTYRSTVAAWRGAFMVPLSAQNREAAGVKAGDVVEVSLALDTDERTVDVPEALAVALAADPAAKAAFDALSYSRQRGHVLAVESAKRPETRDNRVAKIVAELTT